MHFHVVEKLLGAPPRDVGGEDAVHHSGSGPVFTAYAAARAAVGHAARLAWGPAAERAVIDSLGHRDAVSPPGRVTRWRDPHTRSTTTWVLAVCDCVEGTIAELVHAR